MLAGVVRRLLRPVLAVILVTVVVSAIGAVAGLVLWNDDEEDDVVTARVPLPGGVPALDGAVFGPGTEIASGYEVVEGSYLLGPAMPGNGFPRGSRSWSALAVVTGDPGAVLEAYAEQARAEGLTAERDAFGLGRTGCSKAGDDLSEWCVITLVAGPGSSAVQDSLQLPYSRGVVGGHPTSVVRIDRRGYFDANPPIDFRDLPSRPKSARHLDLPKGWEPLLAVGDALTPPLDRSGRPIRVVPGTRPAGPAWRLGPAQCTQQISWMIRVDSDPKEVFAAYLAQVDARPEDAEPYQQTLADGTFIRYEPRTSITEYDSDFTLLSPPDGPSWIRLDTCIV